LVDGIPCLADSDTFYEGKWAQPDRSTGSLRSHLVKKERFFLRQLGGCRGTILDLGCGGGWGLFARVGHSVGVDISVGSLRAARSVYNQVAQASLAALPFPDGSFDYVVSSDVLGHVPLAEKDGVLREVYRVLKPGGRTLHYIEAEGDDPFMVFARSSPDLYTRHVIEPEGHIGLEPAREIVARFRRSGLDISVQRPCYRGLTYLGRYVQYFDNEYQSQSAAIRLLVAASKLATTGPLELASNLAMTLLIELGDITLPESWSGGLLISGVKR
jgi:SAM-dependent methyltransferase